MKFSYINLALISAAFMIVMAAAGYYFNNNAANAGAPDMSSGQEQAAMPVTVEIVKSETVQIWNDYSARLQAVDFAQIRPQVSGTISEIHFQDGQSVEAGDILYVIDPRPFEAAVSQAEAELSAAENQSELTWKELKRAKELIKTDAISKRILDERSSAHLIADAQAEAAKARLERAQIDLDYAYVKAPISGRTGRVEIKIGNLVEAGPGAPILTSVVSTNGIYADFEVDEQTYLKYIRAYAKDREAERQIPVRLAIGFGDKEFNGTIYTFDNQINVTSGTIRARAFFANEGGTLLPGMFASVKMGTPSTIKQIIVNEKAIGTDQDRKFVFIVNDDDMVERRIVKIGESVKDSRVIESGLVDGDRVVTEGIIRLRGGEKVAPQIRQAQANIQSQTDANSKQQ